MNVLLLLRVLLIGVGVIALASLQNPVHFGSDLIDNPLTGSDQAKVEQFSSLAATEWLGPLAPIAISPFFGITILAGISQFGGSYLPLNSFMSSNPALNSPLLFWTFLGLTIVTSLPKFTKVSKPAAQAIDQVEAYAGIITIVLIRVLASVAQPEEPQATAMIVEMGILSFSADMLFSVAAIINIVVINTVKFCFELMVWIVPFPFVDAALEITNKSLCAGLMTVYAFSPMIATAFNLLLFIICLIIFRWCNRNVKYLRCVLCDPIWGLINPAFGVPKRNRLVVFPQTALRPFAPKTKLWLEATESGWSLIQPRWFLPAKTIEISREDCQMKMVAGTFLNSIQIQGDLNQRLIFSRRYSQNLDQLSQLINVPRPDEQAGIAPPTDIAGSII